MREKTSALYNGLVFAHHGPCFDNRFTLFLIRRYIHSRRVNESHTTGGRDSVFGPCSREAAGFDVASIRLSQYDDGQYIDSDQAIFRAHNVTARRLMALAYTLDVSEIIGGPKWLDSDRYDVNAKISAEFAEQRPSRLPEMVESMLADRFQIEIHREQRQVSGFALVVDKKGAKLQPSKNPEKGSETHSNGRRLVATNLTMENFARRLSREVMVVIDRTGLKGGFDFEFDWTPDKLRAVPDEADGAPSIFVALQEQLGLKLESAKIPVSAVVIDRAEKPETD